MNTIIKVLGIFMGAYIGVSILIGLINAYVFDLSVGGVIATAVAAFVSGLFFFHSENRVPTSAESWMYSVGFIVCVATLTVFQLSVLGLPYEFGSLLGTSFALKFFVFYAVLLLLSCRFLFPHSAKGMQLAEEKKAGRS